MKSDQFQGHSSEMKKPTMWLASEDIMGKTPVNVTIEKCFRHRGAEFDQGRKEDVYALSFKKATKQLVLNATNRKELVRQFGVNVKDWEGKTVALTVVDCKMMGKMVKGIRIVESAQKNRQPAPQQQPQPESETPPELPPFLEDFVDQIEQAITEHRLEELVVSAQGDCNADEMKLLEPHIKRKRKELGGNEGLF